MKQKIIEKNVLSLKLDFEDYVSENAKKCILSMLSPSIVNRPSAEDVLKMDFF